MCDANTKAAFTETGRVLLSAILLVCFARLQFRIFCQIIVLFRVCDELFREAPSRLLILTYFTATLKWPSWVWESVPHTVPVPALSHTCVQAG